MSSALLKVIDEKDFANLFVTQLGWNAPTLPEVEVSTDAGSTYRLKEVASFHGMGIWVCEGTPDTEAQRRIDSVISGKTLERLIIYCDGDQQEWRWPRSSGRNRAGKPTLVAQRHIRGQANLALIERLGIISIPMDSEITVPELLEKMRNAFDREAETASRQAARLMGGLYKKLETSGMGEHESSIFLARMLFLMFGDDTDMWKRNHFRDYLDHETLIDGSNLRLGLETLFEVANTDSKQRKKDLSAELLSFPYINGGIFAEQIRIPDLDSEIRESLLESCRFDWAQISPAVFGSMFQTVKTQEARRELGEHYTSEENILKTIEPLFLDELNTELIEAWESPKMLKNLQKRMSKMTFLDPACGCGNFLIVAYRELRALELEILKRLRDLSQVNQTFKGQQLSVDATYELKVGISQFYGIEIEEWPARIAETAMFLVDHLANLRLANEFGEKPERLPITTTATIRVANALRTDWRDVCPIDDNTRIMGNPPFLGSTQQTKEQKTDTRHLWQGGSGTGTLDYVTNWLLIAARMGQHCGSTAALVSTNSVTQGEQPAVIWRNLQGMGIEISFAYRTFPWSNAAPGEAAVHCIIMGIRASALSAAQPAVLFSEAKDKVVVESINPYLVPGPMQFVSNRRDPLSDTTQPMSYGSKPTEAGHLSKISDEEAILIRESDPGAGQFLRLILGAQELIHGKKRWCLWLIDASPADILDSPTLRERVDAVQTMREESPKAMTRRDAATPWLFQEDRQPTTNYLAVPEHSTERRDYVPMAIFPPSVIASNALLTIADASTYTFGMLHSSVFNVWNATVSGRLESRFRISAEITYNNFPWPEVTESQRQAIEAASQAVMDARETHPGSTLADLYDPMLMPADLLDAHKYLDKAVLSAYGLSENTDDAEILTELFKRYEALTTLDQLPLPAKKAARKRAAKKK